MLTSIRMPKWTGLMPSCTAAGKKIGAMIRMIDEGSMKLPAASRITLTTSRKPVRHVLVGQDEREQHGIGDDVEQHRRHVGGITQHARHVPQLQVLVDED